MPQTGDDSCAGKKPNHTNVTDSKGKCGWPLVIGNLDVQWTD